MSEQKVIADPAQHGWEIDPDTGYWMWSKGSGGNQNIDGGHASSIYQYEQRIDGGSA